MKPGIQILKHSYTGLAELWADKEELADDCCWHRTDGPALIREDGFMEWYVDGTLCTNFEIFCTIAQLTEEEKLIVRIKYPRFNRL